MNLCNNQVFSNIPTLPLTNLSHQFILFLHLQLTPAINLMIRRTLYEKTTCSNQNKFTTDDFLYRDYLQQLLTNKKTMFY